MKLKMGMLSGYGTYAGAGGFAVAAIAAFLFGVPMMGEQPMELGALVMAIIAAFVAVRMRMATQKAEDAAKKASWDEAHGGGRAMPLLFLAGSLALLGGCSAGQIARDEVLMPAIMLAADGVKSDCYRGITDAVADGDLEQAAADEIHIRGAGFWWVIAERDRDGIVERFPVWVELRPYGERGIQDMVDDIEIGVAGAASRIERLDLFEEALYRLAE